jgi:hypothetical protein
MDEVSSTPDVTAPVAEEVEQPTTQPESSTGEQQEVEAPETQVSEETQVEEEPKKKGADARIEQLDGEIAELSKQDQIRERVAKRNALRQRIEQDPRFQAPTVDQYLEAGYDEITAEVMALKDQVRMNEQRNSVVETQMALVQDEADLRQQYPEYYSTDPKDLAFTEKATKMWMQAARAQWDRVDQSGRPLPDAQLNYDPSISLYEFLSNQAEIYRSGRTEGVISGQRNAEKMLSSVDVPVSAVAKETPFDKMSLEEKRAYLRAKGHDV